ncbi:MAG: hypothetical protein ACTILW_04250 [Leuconostoc carnosum]|uniref:hypothetical protein n=1 Tax=Leuconostoc carnosum TaxID=1252 RepID=UPI00345DDCEE
MLLFKRKQHASKEVEETVSQTAIETIQQENDDLLDKIEALKLDVSELTAENKRLTEQLTRSKYQRSLIKTSMGLGVLVISYGILNLINEDSRYTAIFLLIEAAFMFMMLRGDDK